MANSRGNDGQTESNVWRNVCRILGICGSEQWTGGVRGMRGPTIPTTDDLGAAFLKGKTDAQVRSATRDRLNETENDEKREVKLRRGGRVRGNKAMTSVMRRYAKGGRVSGNDDIGGVREIVSFGDANKPRPLTKLCRGGKVC